QSKTVHKVVRLGLNPCNRFPRLTDFTFQTEGALTAGTPVFRDVVFETMTIGNPGDIACGNMEHCRSDLAAKLKNVSDATDVDFNRFFERCLKIHQAGAVNDRIETAFFEWLRPIGQ